jgi:flagellar motor switch protein FliN/FliY
MADEEQIPGDAESGEMPEDSAESQPVEDAIGEAEETSAPIADDESAAEVGDEAAEALAAAMAAVSSATSQSADSTPDDEDVVAAAQAAVAEMQQETSAAGGGSGATAFQPPVFGGEPVAPAASGLDLLNDVNLKVSIELGRTRMLVEDVLKLGDGAVVELDKLAGDPVDVYVNGRHVARGEVLVLNDNFCVRVNEIIDGALVKDD